nr:hypothetical protein [uncultured Brumimicrobium sp.]
MKKGKIEIKIDYRKYVSYNAKHDVLVFETWDDVKTLDILLQERVLNYPFNRGNDEEVSTTIQSIKENGWTLSENPSGEEVSLEKFKELLDLSHPLSTNVLIDILELDEGSVMFNHKVYIWGAMVTKDDWTDPNPSEQDFYNCHNPWGHLLFDRNVWVGQP